MRLRKLAEDPTARLCDRHKLNPPIPRDQKQTADLSQDMSSTCLLRPTKKHRWALPPTLLRVVSRSYTQQACARRHSSVRDDVLSWLWTSQIDGAARGCKFDFTFSIARTVISTVRARSRGAVVFRVNHSFPHPLDSVFFLKGRLFLSRLPYIRLSFHYM